MHDGDSAEFPEALKSGLVRLRHRYGNVTPPPLGPALSAFTGVGLTNDKGDLPVTAASKANEPAWQAVGLPNWRARLTKERKRAMSLIAIFISTTLGKIVLGTTAAATSAGIGQWSGVVDIPGLPDRGAAVAPYVDVDEADDDSTEAGDEAPEGTDPTSVDKSTDSSKDAYGSDFSHDVSTDERSESTDSSKDAYGSDFSHDVSTDERSESTDSSKDAYGSDFSHDVSTDERSESTDSSKDAYGSDFSHDVSTDERSESTDWSKDAYGSDFSHDVSTDEPDADDEDDDDEDL
jgi:hypothetical protein